MVPRSDPTLAPATNSGGGGTAKLAPTSATVKPPKFRPLGYPASSSNRGMAASNAVPSGRTIR